MLTPLDIPSTDAQAHARTFETIGREVLGPAYCLFVHRVLERAHEQGIDRLLYVAREGSLFQSLAPRIAAQMEPRREVVPGSYVYLSRLSTALASIQEIGDREIGVVLAKPATPKTLRAILQTFGLSEVDVFERVSRAGIDLDLPIAHRKKDSNVARFLRDADLRADFRNRAANARSLLARYLKQEGVFAARRVALVDIGWSGTIHNHLQLAFQNDPMWPALFSYYLAIHTGTLAGYDAGDLRMKGGLLIDTREQHGLPARAIFFFPELFEQAARADHGTTIGYREVGARVEPILREQGADRDAERKSQWALDAFRRGIDEFSGNYADFLRGHAGNWQRARDAVWRAIERIVFFPTPAEIAAFVHIQHTDDWGAGSHRALVETRASLRAFEFVSEFRGAYWKPGFVAYRGGPLAARLFRECIDGVYRADQFRRRARALWSLGS